MQFSTQLSRLDDIDNQVRKAFKNRDRLPQSKRLYHANLFVLRKVQQAQNGLCFHCSQRIGKDDIILSARNGSRTKYYHCKCGIEVGII